MIGFYRLILVEKRLLHEQDIFSDETALKCIFEPYCHDDDSNNPLPSTFPCIDLPCIGFPCIEYQTKFFCVNHVLTV